MTGMAEDLPVERAVANDSNGSLGLVAGYQAGVDGALERVDGLASIQHQHSTVTAYPARRSWAF
jgi:hypothetical protein